MCSHFFFKAKESRKGNKTVKVINCKQNRKSKTYEQNQNLILLKDELGKLKLRKPDQYRKRGEKKQAMTLKISSICMMMNYKDVL